MTLSEQSIKFNFIFCFCAASATVSWWLTLTEWTFVPHYGAVVGLVLVNIAAFKPQYSPFSAGYALFEGLFIGGISAILKPCILECYSP
jgi:uncharacterized YccA/Bax inhibitor family protein